MNNNELKHVGVLGMKWGHRKAGGDGSSSGGNRSARIKVAEELTAVRAQRSKKVKLADWLLSGPQHGKLFSEKHGTSELAVKGSKLSNKLEDMRKYRTRGEKITDMFMTPGTKTGTFTERSSGEKRKIVAITAAVIAGSIGLMKMSSLYR